MATVCTQCFRLHIQPSYLYLQQQPSIYRAALHAALQIRLQAIHAPLVAQSYVNSTGTRARFAVQSMRRGIDASAAQHTNLKQLPTIAYGQVTSAEANFVRVNISHLEAAEHHVSTSQQQDWEAAQSQTSATTSNSSSTQQLLQDLPCSQLLCTVRALLKKMNQRVLVGDRVRVNNIDWNEGRAVVESIGPRSSELADPAVANVNHVLLLFGLTQPPFEPAQVSRFLVSVGAAGLPVTLALNKCDLLPASEVTLRLNQVASWGYDAVAVSCETGQGLDQLAAKLAGAVSVVAGPSGAGKSSLINALRMGRHKPDAPAAVAAAVAAAGGVHAADGQRVIGSSSSSSSSNNGSFMDVSGAAARQQDLELHLTTADRTACPLDHDLHSGSNSGSSNGSNGSSSNGSSFMDIGLEGTSNAPAADAHGPVHLSDNTEDSVHDVVLVGRQATTTTNSSSSSSSRSQPGFLVVGEMSKIGRGKHTTRTVTLIELPFGGLMADSPGFNQPTLDRVSSSQLGGLFPEFVAAVEGAGGCRFSDCMHLAEPGCAVTAGDFERYEHYLKFLVEIKAREEYDVRVMQLAKQRREGSVKVISGRGGVTRYEARLNTKKHRNTSRRRSKQSLWEEESE